MTEAERINYIIEHFEGGNAADFARKIGKSAPAVSKLRKGQYRFLSYVDVIAKAYPTINCRWLLTGYGEPEAPETSRSSMKTRLDRLTDAVDAVIERLESMRVD